MCTETLRYRSVPQNRHNTLLKEYMSMQPVWHVNISKVRNIFQDHAKEPDLCKRPNSFQIETDLDDIPVEATKLIACLTGHQFYGHQAILGGGSDWVIVVWTRHQVHIGGGEIFIYQHPKQYTCIIMIFKTCNITLCWQCKCTIIVINVKRSSWSL